MSSIRRRRRGISKSFRYKCGNDGDFRRLEPMWDSYDHMMREFNAKMPNYPDTLPDPTVSYEDFLVAIMKVAEPVSVGHWRRMAAETKQNATLWMKEASKYLSRMQSDAMLDKTPMEFTTNQLTETVTGYGAKPEVKAYWEMGLANNMTGEDILKGWRTMNSIMAEVEVPPAPAGAVGSSP